MQHQTKFSQMFPLTKDYLQRRRRLRRVAIPSSQALSLLGRDLREAHLQVLLGSGGGIDQALLMHLMQLQINFFHHLFGTSQQPKQKKFQNLCHPVLRTCVLRKQHQHMLGNQGSGLNFVSFSKPSLLLSTFQIHI